MSFEPCLPSEEKGVADGGPAACTCGTLFVSAPPEGADPAPAARSTAGRGRRLAAEQLWVDVHAHPGRNFLRGMPPDDTLVALLGGDAMDSTARSIRDAGVALAAFATVADFRVLGATPEGGLCAARDFRPGEARADHERQLGALQTFAAQPGRRPVLRRADLEAARAADETGIFLTCEGGDFLDGRLDGLGDAYARGVRSVTIVHYRVNEIGDIQTEAEVHHGLTPFGRDVVAEMNRLGMIIDLAHATHAVTRDVLASSTAPVMISHSHLAAAADSHPRLLTLEHARAVVAEGGLIGAWPAGVAATTFEEYVDEIERLIDGVGCGHVAIGTDMDANYRPVVQGYDQFPDIADALLARGYGDEDVGAVMGGNFLRLLERVCGR